MKIELKKFNIETKFNDVVKLTDDIKAFVESTGVKEGQCIIVPWFARNACRSFPAGHRA